MILHHTLLTSSQLHSLNQALLTLFVLTYTLFQNNNPHKSVIMRFDIIIASLTLVSSAVAHPHAHARFHSLGKKAVSKTPSPANSDNSMQDGMMYTMDMPPNTDDDDGIMYTMDMPASDTESGKKTGTGKGNKKKKKPSSGKNISNTTKPANGKKKGSKDAKNSSKKNATTTTAGTGKKGSPSPQTTVTKSRQGGKKTKTPESPKATKSSGGKKKSAGATTTESARGGKKTRAPKATQSQAKSSGTKKSDDTKRGDAPKVKVGIVNTESGKPRNGVASNKKTGIKNSVQTPASGNSGSASSSSDSPAPAATNNPTGGSPRTKPCCCCDTSVMKTVCKKIPFDQECFCLQVTCDSSAPV